MARSKSTTASLKTFPQFSKLPTELQLLVWEFTIIFRIVTPVPGGGPAPSTFSVNHQSRSVTRPQYVLVKQNYPWFHIVRDKQCPFGLFINFRLDFLYITPLFPEDLNDRFRSPLHRNRNFLSLDHIATYLHYCRNPTLESIAGQVNGLVIDMEDSEYVPSERGSGYWSGLGSWKTTFQSMMKNFPSVETVVCVPDGKKGKIVLDAEKLFPVDFEGGKGWKNFIQARRLRQQGRAMKHLSVAFEEAKLDSRGDFYSPQMKQRKIEFEACSVRKNGRKYIKQKDRKSEKGRKREWADWLLSKARRSSESSGRT